MTQLVPIVAAVAVVLAVLLGAVALLRRQAARATVEIEAGSGAPGLEGSLRQILDSLPRDRYVDPHPLGSGGTAQIFRVRDLKLDRMVAFKMMDPEVMQDPEMRARFLREARTMAQITHTGLPSIYDVAETPHPYLVMQYIEGRHLEDYFSEKGPVPSDLARDWLAQAARALEGAHEQGIVHRDVKPENLMLDSKGRIWVIDFGLARGATHKPITRVGVVMGTPTFVAPEQLLGNPPDERVDVYGLAATGYYLLSGRYPYRLEDLVANSGVTPKELPEAVESQLAATLSLALARNPEDRPGSMKEFRALLEAKA